MPEETKYMVVQDIASGKLVIRNKTKVKGCLIEEGFEFEDNDDDKIIWRIAHVFEDEAPIIAALDTLTNSNIHVLFELLLATGQNNPVPQK
ncbi:MAG: hypothetical protein V1838_01200 [Patescibacteria group bacterium]